MYGHQYSPPEVEFLRKNLPGRSHQELTRMFNERFQSDLSVKQITAACKNRGYKNGLNGCFPKGNVPFNKGRKGWQAGGRSGETKFKPGAMPRNHRPVGSERVNVDGYTEVKIAEPKKWRAKHVIIWEAVHGPVPAGHAVIFGDGNRENVVLENLLLVSRRQLAVMNKKGLYGGSVELTKVGQSIAQLCMGITDKGKRKHSQR